MVQPDHTAENRRIHPNRHAKAEIPQTRTPSLRRKRIQKKGPPLPVVLLTDTALMGLCLFALCAYLFLFPRPLGREGAAASVPPEAQSPATSAPIAAEQAEATRPDAQEATSAPQAIRAVAADPPSAMIVAPDESGGWFAHKYSASGTVQTDSSYQSANVNISIQKVQEDGLAYFVADLYVRSLDHLRTSLAFDTYGSGCRQSVHDMAEQSDAILAITGDYYGNQSRGVVIRNGTVYRKTTNGDVCVLYLDGTLQTYDKKAFSIDQALEKGVYQAWSFGPRLLDDGQPMTKFNTSVGRENPRAAIGYYEPGHYCFVVVDGRQRGYSRGMTMEELSQLFYRLGCSDAYNLDGGQTAQMYFAGSIINQPHNGGRDVSDIVYIGD